LFLIVHVFSLGRVVLYITFMVFPSPNPGQNPGQKSDQKLGQKAVQKSGH